MKNQETGEFELLVGNGQIISGFFILALLLAVFFAMGFIVARAKYQQEPVSAASASTMPEARETAAAPVPAPVERHPVPKPAAIDQQSASAPVESKVESKADREQTVREQAPVLSEAPGGNYWQVSAIANLDAARALQQTIKDMGLPVTLSQGPNKVTRVLVGPYKDLTNMAKVKTQLENAGLHPVKRTQ